jgi:hypothetical protein
MDSEKVHSKYYGDCEETVDSSAGRFAIDSIVTLGLKAAYPAHVDIISAEVVLVSVGETLLFH